MPEGITVIRNKEKAGKNTVTSFVLSPKSKKQSGFQSYCPKMSINPCKFREKMSSIGKPINTYLHTCS